MKLLPDGHNALNESLKWKETSVARAYKYS